MADCTNPVILLGNCDSLLTGSCNAPCAESCGCAPAEVPCPQPFYGEDPSVVQSNCTTVCQPIFFTSLKFDLAWNIPACGATATTRVLYLKTLPIGSNLWVPNRGYFEVTAFDPDTGNITIKNNCLDGNLPPGTEVPKCAEFVVVPPPCCTGGGSQNPTLFPYVAIDFTAPGVGGCLDITVTSVNGLSVGHLVQIGSGTYRVNGISSSSIINICNDGSGITPGTSVIAKNSSGDYQYPVILIDSNVCNNATTAEGKILVCNAGVQSPLVGTTPGMIPVLNNADGTVTFQFPGNPIATCTVLTSALTLSTGQVSYTLIVGDSSGFVIGDILQLGTRTDRLTITGLPDATTIVGDMAPVPGSIQVIPIGTTVCTVGCCEDLQDQVDVIDTTLSTAVTNISTLTTLVNFNHANLNLKQEQVYSTNKTATLTIGGTVNVNSNDATVIIPNITVATGHDMVVLLGGSAHVAGTVVLDASAATYRILLSLSFSKNGGAFLPFPGGDVYLAYPKVASKTFDTGTTLSGSLSFVVVALDTDTYVLRARVDVSDSAGASTFTIAALGVSIGYIGVAV